MAAFARLLDVLDELREKCPWDKKQTNESLRPNTIEETYELCGALVDNDQPNICKELGDVLLHVCFYARIAKESGHFDIADVCNMLVDKLIYRHPHVYHPSQIGAAHPQPLPYGQEDAVAPVAQTSQQVIENWEQLKLKEKDGNKRVLSGVPEALPSMIKAYRIQDKARNVGFDWEKREDVWKKVREELDELEAEFNQGSKETQTEELGDFLFSVINAARLYHLNPDNALEHTNRKFIKRFNYVEEQSIEQGRNIKDLTLKEMDELWEKAKGVLSLLILPLVMVISLVACNSGKQKVPFEYQENENEKAAADSTVFGLCGEASAMNTLQLIADNGDTLNLSLLDAKENNMVFGGYACGDRLAVIPNANRSEARIVINESTLMGDWGMPNPLDGSSEVGISIREGGIVEGIEQTTLTYKSWRIKNGQLELVTMREGGGELEETNIYSFEKLDDDSLIISNAEDRFEYARIIKGKEEASNQEEGL